MADQKVSCVFLSFSSPVLVVCMGMQLDSYLDARDPNLDPIYAYSMHVTSPTISLAFPIRIFNILIFRFDVMCIEKTEVKVSSVKLLYMFPASEKMFYL